MQRERVAPAACRCYCDDVGAGAGPPGIPGKVNGGNPDGSGKGIGSVDGIGNGMVGRPGMPKGGGAASSVAAPASVERGLVGALVGAGVGAAVGCTGVPTVGTAVGAAPVGAAVGGAIGAEGAVGVAVAVGRLVESSNSPVAMATATIPIASTLMAMRSQTERRRGPPPETVRTGGRFA